MAEEKTILEFGIQKYGYIYRCIEERHRSMQYMVNCTVMEILGDKSW